MWVRAAGTGRARPGEGSKSRAGRLAASLDRASGPLPMSVVAGATPRARFTKARGSTSGILRWKRAGGCRPAASPQPYSLQFRHLRAILLTGPMLLW